MTTAPIHLVQTSIHVPNAVRHLKPFLSRTAIDDDSLVLKSVLTEAFGGPMIRPWVIQAQRGPLAIIVGYSLLSGPDLERRRALALPSLQLATGEALSVPMPPIRKGDCFRFAVRLVPSVRVTPKEGRRHGERDAFLAAFDEAGEGANLKREGVYIAYLRGKLLGAELEACMLAQFQLRRFARPKAESGHSQKTLPEASLVGTLTVKDQVEFTNTITRGIGRHRAYGFGMMRLEPAAPSR
jgi:CRISPR system Cascade subunit CasE